MNGKAEKRAAPPLVTVVVISYNHGPYLKVCLDSIAEQTYQKIQCIVVDNASADGSPAVIEHFADQVRGSGSVMTVEPILSPNNSHLTGAMVQGLAKARGAYVMFVDGDDYLLSACVEAHVTAHLATRVPVGATSIDMYQSRGDDLVIGGSHGGAYIMSGRGQKSRFCRMSNLDAFEFAKGSSGLDLQERDLHLVDPSETTGWIWAPTSGLCFRREAVELFFGHVPNVGGGTDAYLIRGISALTGSILIDRPLAVYRLHDTNMFTKHPALTGLVQFDKTQLHESDAEVARELVECFRKQATVFAARLERLDTYIEAVDMVSKVGRGLSPPKPFSSYIVYFLVANRETLIGAFGTYMYKRWVRRYFSIRDRISVATGTRS